MYYFAVFFIIACPNINRGELKLVIVLEENIDHDVIKLNKEDYTIIVLNKELPEEIKTQLYARYRYT